MIRKHPGRTVRKQRGFTLLEVMLALTITAFVVGGLMTLSGGSKQLAWRSQESLHRAAEVRAQINFALLEDEFGQVEPILINDTFSIRGGDLLPTPTRRTQASLYSLQYYEVINDETEAVVIGSRWVRFDQPR